jgi:hypothetical protein
LHADPKEMPAKSTFLCPKGDDVSVSRFRLGSVLLALNLLNALPRTLSAQSVTPDVAFEALGMTQTGDWGHKKDLDPISDEDRSMAVTLPTELDTSRATMLAIKCESNGFGVFYVWGKYFIGDRDDEVLVDWRVGKGEPVEDSFWHLVPGSHESAFMPESQESKFLREAMVGSKVVFRVTDPRDGDTKLDTFSLKGFSDAISHLPCLN